MDPNSPDPNQTTAPTQKKILVVEDEQTLRDLYVEILKSANFAVDQAANGEEGYNAMSRGGYDLVLLDIIMPKMDGIQILQKLSTSPPQSPNKSIIVLSNLGQDDVIGNAVSLGAHGYMIKSEFTPDEVIKQVNTFLEETK